MITIKEAINQIKPPTIIELFKNKNLSKINKEDLDRIIERTNDISNKIIANKGKISLILGQVQSGKTLTYLSLISHFFDKKSNFIVITPAIDNILFEQTVERVNGVFESSNIKIFKINSLFDKKNIDVTEVEKAFKNNQKVILLSLKNSKRLRDVVEVIKIIKNKVKTPVFIDDEGDQASFDNVASAESTAVYKEILNIYNSINDFNFLTITATPMPHIFVNKQYSIKPDYAFYIEPGDGYLGINEFMNNDNNFIVKVDDKENESFFKNDGKALPNSFKKALLSFFVASSYIHLSDGNFETQSMLLHTERRVTEHKKMQLMTSNLISNLIKDLKNKKDLTLKMLKEIVEDFKINTPNNFVNLLIEHMINNEVIIINGDGKNKDRDNIGKLHTPKNKNYIYIGSSMLQRGVTIKNLLHTYFTYRSNNILNADTVLQRARWFGYRKNKEFIRVFMSNDAISDFIALSATVPEMNEKIMEIEKEGISFKNIERTIYLPHAKMKGTRNSVIINGRSKLSRYLSDYSNKSSIISEELFGILKKTKTQKIMKNQYFRGISLANYDEFKEWMTKERLDKLYGEIVPGHHQRKALEDYIFNERPNFCIVNMFTKKHDYRERDYTANGIISLSQGHSNTYVGDRYWYKDNSGRFKNSIILQLFKIKIKDTGEFIYKCALVSTNKIHGYYIHAKD